MFENNPILDNQRKPSSSPKSVVIVIIIVGLALVGLIIVAAFSSPAEDNSDNLINTDLPQDLDYRAVEEVYDEIRLRYDGDLNEQQLIEGMKKGLVEAIGNEYSQYITLEDADDFWASLYQEFVGVGIYIEKKDDQVIVIKPIAGSPADQAGLQAGDVIVTVDGQTVGMLSLEEVASMIKGESGTEVMLTIKRQDQDDFEVGIVRSLIREITAEHKIEDNVGILTINQFVKRTDGQEDTLSLIQQAVDDFITADVEAIILDLRNNPGGDVLVTQEISALWLPLDQTVWEDRKNGQKIQDAKPLSIGDYNQKLAQLPLVILINGYSASASEILAGALRTHNETVLIGEQSFGKTSVQTIIENLEEEDQGILKLTTSHWHTPDGLEVRDGIVPDINIEDNPDTLDIDEQLQKAFEILESK